jgi:hypothetical protein
MDVLSVTLTVSVCLTLIFVISFAAHLLSGKGGAVERDSLLPLEEDTRPVPHTTAIPIETRK